MFDRGCSLFSVDTRPLQNIREKSGTDPPGVDAMRPLVTWSEGILIMPLYEHVFLARPEISAKQVEVLTQNFKDIFVQNGGKCGKDEYWGLRATASQVRKNRKAHYVLVNLDGPPSAVAEMERLMSINEDILRFLTIRVEEWEETPSVMMRRDTRSNSSRDGASSYRNDRGSGRFSGQAPNGRESFGTQAVQE